MTSTRFAIMLLAVVAPLTQQDHAQEPVTTLKLQTRMVAVAAVVRDKQGQAVHDLTKDDFVLKEDGKPQPIRYFSQGSDLPLTLALMVDTSGSQREFIDDETNASKAFFPAMLTRPIDRAVLVQFDNNVLQLQRMTNSMDDLVAGLRHLSEPHSSHGSGGTLLYDAIYATARNVLGKQAGRRAMVILTDGGDNGSSTSLTEAIATAQRQDVVIYSVFYSEDGRTSAGKHVLDSISEQTGGRVYIVSKKLTLEQIYAQIADDMRLQYQMGYVPPESRPGTYHTIELTPKNKTLSVDSRKGYFTRP